MLVVAQRMRAPTHGDREQTLRYALRDALEETSTNKLFDILSRVLLEIRLVDEVLSVANREERAQRVVLRQMIVFGL